MNDIKRESLIENTEKLLFDIRELLTELVEQNRKPVIKPIIETKTEKKTVITNKSNKKKKG